MSNFMENGPSNHNGVAEQVWERPWTLEEMQKSSTNWSLAADSGLFLFLQDFSQKMLSKTHEIEKQLDGLIRDTKATDSHLHTVFNDFLMLSNTQFIENRVYDEEVEELAPKPETIERPPEQEKTREQKEAELIPKVQEAVNYGLKVLECAFEQLDIKAGNSDSEDEEALEKVEPILEAKDLYVDRPLPYLIGSQAFMDQDDVGLGDLSSDEMSIDNDRDSVIESEDGETDEHSDEDFDQDDEIHGNFKKKSSVVSYDDADEENEDDEDSDIFAGSDKDEDELGKDTGQSSFADELAARIKGETVSKSEADRTSLSSGPSITQKKSKAKKEPKPHVEDDQDEMFKPPNMEDEEYSPFGGKGGLFSGGKGLFDDDDEGDLFSDAPKNEPAEEEQSVNQTEPLKTKKIPTGAVSIFPENKLFGSPNDSDSLESKDSKSPVRPKVQAAPKHTSVGGGLFDDDENDDDFFSRKILKISTPVGQEKQMPKKTVDLFGGDEEEEDDYDEDGSMFSGKSSTAPPQQDKSIEGDEETRPPEKKPPAGAISMFGPGTKNILVEGLKKRRPSTSEESAKSEESVPPPEAVKSSPALGASEKAASKSLFSDDEDSQIFASETKSKSKSATQNKPSKALLSIFADEEEEDLFSLAPKPKSVQVKKTSLQPKKPVSSGLFSDDEDQWMSPKPGKESPEVRPGGMKQSTSAPSSLPSVKGPQKDSLFDEDDDLFAATKELSKKSSQRASLLFEDEEDDDDEDKEPLFGFKPPANKTPSEPKASGAPSLFVPEHEDNLTTKATDKIAEEKKSVKSILSSDDSTEIKKKPAGAVSLFGGIDIFGDKQDRNKTKSPEEIAEGEDLQKDGPPPMGSKGPKAKKTALSLFDVDDYDEDESPDEIVPAPKISKPAEKNTLKDHGPRIKSTGVFQDEELLFSHTQQRDNDPDVDLFATSPKPTVPSQSSVKPMSATLFGDDDDNDLFSSAKPKAPPKVPEKPSKPKTDETDKSTLTSSKASLVVNPASLLPGAVPRIPGAVSVIPGLAPSSLPAAARSLPDIETIPDRQTSREGGVSFESPAQVNTLQNANKSRAKGAGRRRPQTRAARHLAAQRSVEVVGEGLDESSSTQADEPDMAASLPTSNPFSVRPSELNIPVTIPAAAKRQDEAVKPKRFLDAEYDLFDSDDLFATASTTKSLPSSKHKTKPPEEGHKKASKTQAGKATKKDQAPSIFDSRGDDLFATVKQKPVQKAKQPVSFLDDEDNDDIFGAGKSKSTESKNSKTEVSSTKPDFFQDKVQEPPKAQKKSKDSKSLDASLFDDDVDIFADLTGTTKPKEKKAKKKVETKSIFDDDMDDIFSAGTAQPSVKPSSTPKKNQNTQDHSSIAETGHNIFDDPLNVFGGN